MKIDYRGDEDHHDGTSDAMPGGYADQRRPGELVFALVLIAGSGALLWSAFGISGLEALSSAGAVPMAVTAVMLVSALLIFFETLRKAPVRSETLSRDILPPLVIFLVLGLLAFGLLLVPLGFVPTAALFLLASMKFMGRRPWPVTLAVALGSLLVIWLVFRLVFTVLLPTGILPEAELIQAARNLLAGGAN